MQDTYPSTTIPTDTLPVPIPPAILPHYHSPSSSNLELNRNMDAIIQTDVYPGLKPQNSTSGLLLVDAFAPTTSSKSHHRCLISKRNTRFFPLTYNSKHSGRHHTTGQNETEIVLGQSTQRSGGDLSTGRTLESGFNCIAIAPPLLPATCLYPADTLMSAMKDVFYAHKHLYESSNLLHGDITPQNLRYTRTNVNTTHGILVDFDLRMVPTPKPADDVQPNLTFRTRSQSYLAIELHHEKHEKPEYIPFLYRHDLESFLYSLSVVVSLFHRGKPIVRLQQPMSAETVSMTRSMRPVMFELFVQHDDYRLRLSKMYDLMDMGRCRKTVKPRIDSEGIKIVMSWLWRRFISGYSVKKEVDDYEEYFKHEDDLKMEWDKDFDCKPRPPPPYDTETMGGRVSAETFQKVFEFGDW